MQPGTKRILRFLGNWAINTLAVAVAVMILRDHISYGNNVVNLLMVSLLLGILNAFVRPILMLLALPLLIFTLGLFTLVINALLLYLCRRADGPYFHVDSFGYAFLGVTHHQHRVRRAEHFDRQRQAASRPAPSAARPKSDDGNGPVIDV